MEDGRYLIQVGKINFRVNAATAALFRASQSSSDLNVSYANYLQDVEAPQITLSVFANMLARLQARLMDNAPASDRGIFRVWWRKQLFDGQKLGSIVNLVSPLFHAPMMALMSATFLSSFGLFIWLVPFSVLEWRYHSSHIAVFLSVSLCNIVIHEFGHLAVCRALGVPHGGMGVGVFGLFPVAYVELGELWRQPIHKRILINLGGVYAQSLLALLFMGCYFLSRDSVFQVAVYGSVALACLQLVPLRRFDGYWLIKDAFENKSNLFTRHQMSLSLTSDLSKPIRGLLNIWSACAFLIACYLFSLFYRAAWKGLKELQYLSNIFVHADEIPMDFSVVQWRSIFTLIIFFVVLWGMFVAVKRSLETGRAKLSFSFLKRSKSIERSQNE